MFGTCDVVGLQVARSLLLIGGYWYAIGGGLRYIRHAWCQIAPRWRIFVLKRRCL